MKLRIAVSLVFILTTAVSFGQLTPATIDPKDDNALFVDPEISPYFPGGEPALLKFISDHIIYPKGAKASKIQGTVYVTFNVEKDGRITGLRVVRGICAELDAEAIRVMKLMPTWIPGELEGKKVAMRCNLPIKFRLQ